MAKSRRATGRNVAAEAQAAARKAVSEAQAAARKAAAESKIAEETKAVVAEAKPVVKKAVEETKKATKKATTRRKKKDMKVNAYVEYYGKQVHEDIMIANVKKAWIKAGHRIGEIETMDLYIKPEEDKVYYVINGTESGSVEF